MLTTSVHDGKGVKVISRNRSEQRRAEKLFRKLVFGMRELGVEANVDGRFDVTNTLFSHLF